MDMSDRKFYGSGCFAPLIILRITYTLHEDDELALCPVTLLLSLATADNAFASPHIRSPADIYRLKVPARLKQLPIPWRPDILEKPILRACSFDGVSPDRALQYEVFACNLRELGTKLGLQEPLTAYCFRRGSGNAVNGL